MNTWVKASLMSLTILSAIGLTACQSSATATPEKPPKNLQHRADDLRKPFDREGKRLHKLTAEERAKFEEKMQEHRAQRDADRKALQQACEGKAGQTISVKLGDQSVEGKCEVRFQPTKPERLQPPAAPKNAPAV
ncbi:hypothetical protein GCM10023206_28330 [Acinetobacter puyangensis]|uniref:Uncharacterized protein n=1 Tax=Acinetobacter puyangensis TaxID=1096779 RepID=A0A240E5B1_9GAMM|nr:hypothetical protein [Acinetobacter puyangensis]SNX43399.1 hypothetical protein SAMN05421731_101435 [Acinetobacter puyangensis]